MASIGKQSPLRASCIHGTEGVELLIDVHDGIHREAKSLARLVHHLLHRVEGVASEDAAIGDIDVELDGNLADIIAGAFVLLPDMLEIRTGNQHQVVFTNHLVRVAHNAAHTLGMLDEIKFVDFMVMDGIGKLLLAPIRNIEHILAHQRRDFVNDLTFHLSLNS